MSPPPNMSLDAEALIFLVEILSAENLSAAARKLKMSRANVSYHLNRIERTLGQQLLRRTTRHIEPTEIGLRLYRHGCIIQAELAAARDSVSELGRTLQGRIRLSVPTGFGQDIVGDWLIDFKRLYPAVVLDVLFENHVLDLLREEVDISLRVTSNPPENLIARHIATVQYAACASREFAAKAGMPTHPQDLIHYPVITSGVLGRNLRLTAHLDGTHEQVLLEPTLVSENFAFLHKAVLSGLGVGIIPDYIIADDIRQGRVTTALNAWKLSIFGSKIFMMYMPSRYQTRSVSTFIKYILERVRQRDAELTQTAAS